MTTATIHYMRNGRAIYEEQQESSGLAPQQFAKLIADLTSTGLRGFTAIDQVRVWFGPVDGHEPDATAEVPR